MPSKLKATSYHLLLNLIFFSIFIIILRSYWYPEPYFTASGGWQGLKIVALIDVVLGPILTFIIFNPLKPSKELKIDLSIIITLQISALSWGVYTVYQQRPIATVFWGNSFYTVPYSDIKLSYSKKLLRPLKQQPHLLYYVDKPSDVDGIISINTEVQEKQLAPFQLIERFEQFDLHFNIAKQYSINIDEVIQKNAKMNHELSIILSKTQTTIRDNVYLKLTSRYQNIILIFSQKGELLGYIKAPYKDKSQI